MTGKDEKVFDLLWYSLDPIVFVQPLVFLLKDMLGTMCMYDILY